MTEELWRAMTHAAKERRDLPPGCAWGWKEDGRACSKGTPVAPDQATEVFCYLGTAFVPAEDPGDHPCVVQGITRHYEARVAFGAPNERRFVVTLFDGPKGRPGHERCYCGACNGCAPGSRGPEGEPCLACGAL